MASSFRNGSYKSGEQGGRGVTTRRTRKTVTRELEPRGIKKEKSYQGMDESVGSEFCFGPIARNEAI